MPTTDSNYKKCYYIGSTQDINSRLTRHNKGLNKFTKSGIPWEIIYFEKFDTRSEAYNRELFIKKKKSRSYIEKLMVPIRL